MDSRTEDLPVPPNGNCGHEYLLDLMTELAALARGCGEVEIAIHLEAILAVEELRRRR